MTRDTDEAASGRHSRLAFDSQLRTWDAPLISLNGIAAFASVAALARTYGLTSTRFTRIDNTDSATNIADKISETSRVRLAACRSESPSRSGL
jgi:hypothetical protein